MLLEVHGQRKSNAVEWETAWQKRRIGVANDEKCSVGAHHQCGNRRHQWLGIREQSDEDGPRGWCERGPVWLVERNGTEKRSRKVFLESQ